MLDITECVHYNLQDDKGDMVDLERISELNTQAIAADYAEDPTVFHACLDLMVEQRTSAQKLHERLTALEDFQDAPLEAVKKIVGSFPFVQAYAEATTDETEYCRKRIKRKMPRMLRRVENLASEENDDKRTRTSNLHWYLGVGGLSPTQRIEAGEDLATIARGLFAPAEKKEEPSG